MGDLATLPNFQPAPTTYTHTAFNAALAAITVGARTITPAKLSAVNTGKVLGRRTAGAGDMEEQPASAAGFDLLGQPDAANMRIFLGVAGEAGVRVRQTAQADSTNNTTLIDIPGMVVTVATGNTYTIESYFSFNTPGSPTNSGIKFVFTGTATVSALAGLHITQGQSQQMSSGSTATALPLSLTASAVVVNGVALIHLTFTCSSTGTLKWQFSQENAGGGTSSVKLGSFMKLFAY